MKKSLHGTSVICSSCKMWVLFTDLEKSKPIILHSSESPKVWVLIKAAMCASPHLEHIFTFQNITSVLLHFAKHCVFKPNNLEDVCTLRGHGNCQCVCVCMRPSRLLLISFFCFPRARKRGEAWVELLYHSPLIESISISMCPLRFSCACTLKQSPPPPPPCAASSYSHKQTHSGVKFKEVGGVQTGPQFGRVLKCTIEYNQSK